MTVQKKNHPLKCFCWKYAYQASNPEILAEVHLELKTVIWNAARRAGANVIRLVAQEHANGQSQKKSAE